MLNLSTDTRLPIYQRLADMLRQGVVTGETPPGSKIPSEIVLANTFGLAPGTVRRSMDKLVEEGLLYRKQGHGTFIRKPVFDRSFFRFFRSSDSAGKKVIPDSKILQRKILKIPKHIGDKLEIETDEPAIQLFRLRLIDDRPIFTEEIWISLEKFKSFMDIPLQDIGKLLYPVYADVCNRWVARVQENLTVEMANKKIAKILEINQNLPVVALNRLAFDYAGLPIEWRCSFGRADYFNYNIEIY